jgi:hypothetical protein
MAEIAPAGGGPNRLFLVIALGLVGLLLLGLIAVGGILLIPRILQSSAPPPTQRIAITTPTRVIVAAATQAPPDTDTPEPSATFVVVTTPGVGAAIAGTVAPTSTTPTNTPLGGTLPQSGLGEDLMVLAGGIVLVMIIFAARRARSVGSV